jgi:glucose/arabinose dehydrogenase
VRTGSRCCATPTPTARAEVRSVFLQGLNSPFGMALVGDRLYVANTDAVREYPYTTGQTRIESAGRQLADLPGGPLNHHWTKSLIASPDGSKLYATVGSNSNVGENGMDAENGRAAIWEIDRASGSKRLFATGLRNPNGMAWMPGASGAPTLWTVVNERDEIGSDLVPDYLSSVRDGGFYGWPYSWYGQHVDVRVEPQRPDLVAKAIVPDFALGAHVAALGLTASGASTLPRAWAVPGRPSPRRLRRAGPPRQPRRTASSSACTARGTGARSRATRSSTSRSREASRRGCRSTC